MLICDERGEIRVELSEIIGNLCDWVHENGLSVRYLTIGNHSENGGIYVTVSFGKKVNGEKVELTREFYLGGVLCKENWERYRNDLELKEMIREFKEYKG